MTNRTDNKNLALTCILLIEDDDVDYMWVKRTLERRKESSFDLTRVSQLKEGVECLKKEKFQLILLDLSLPDSRGIETFIAVREASPKIPVVVFSGDSEQSVALEAMSKGAQDYLIKGKADGEMLERVIHYAIERRRVQQMREEFISMIAHDLGSPLAIAIESVSQMLDGMVGNMDQDQKEYLSVSLRSMRRLQQISRNLLEMTKAELGKVQLRIQPFNLVHTAQDVVAGYRQMAGDKHITIKEEYAQDVMEVQADKEKIDQVFMNLVGNAIKYTDQGEVTISVLARNAQIECRVSDTGPGIPEEYADKVFNMFQQVQGETKKLRKQGSGIGLAVAKQIVEAHHGKIWVESKLNQGASFIFVIPKDVNA